eukprot:SAG11_NODE_1614_length_4579_cov_11.855357_2_plen_104_part_00
MWVRSSAILLLQGGGKRLQSTAAMGGTLEVQVYSGNRTTQFALVEDDGHTLDYANAAKATAAIRTVTFRWDGAQTLSWAVAGAFVGDNSYSHSTADTNHVTAH